MSDIHGTLSTRLVPLAAACLVSCGFFTISGLAFAASPNFVVLLTDDQSWVGTSLRIDPGDDRTESDYYVTPNIERLAPWRDAFHSRLFPGSLLLSNPAQAYSSVKRPRVTSTRKISGVGQPTIVNS